MIKIIIMWLFLSYVLWVSTSVFYIAVMKLRGMRDSGELAKLHWTVTVTAYNALYIGLVLDMLLNFVVMTVIFVEFPKELLVTQRVRRHKFFGCGWRKSIAMWICQKHLAPFDAKHCE